MAKSRRAVFTNMVWRMAEQFGAKIVNCIVQVVLARIIAPESYGLIALISVFTTLLQVFVDSGLGTALVQKKDSDDTDFSTVFYTNIIFCLILYFILFFCAPLIAKFYGNKQLVLLIRVLGLNLIISGLKNVQQAYVSKNLIFKKFFFATIIGTVISAFIGIFLAVKGYGVWAIVFQQLSNSAIDTLMLWITVKWRPALVFSFERLKQLFNYGWKLLASSFLGVICTNIRQLIIGKMYSPADLAFYNKGQTFPDVIVNNINSSIDSVMLPVMTEEQDNKQRIKELTRRAIKTSCFVMAPLMMGIFAVAPTLISFVFTDKWLPCVFFLRIACIINIFQPINTANLNAIKAIGRSGLVLKMEIVKSIFGIITLLCSMWFGVKAIAIGFLVYGILVQLVNSWPNRKILKYNFFQQLMDIMPSIIIAFVVATIIMIFDFKMNSLFFKLFIQIVCGAFIYLFLSKLFKIDSYNYIKERALSWINSFKSKNDK